MYRLNDEKVFYDYAEGQAVLINYLTGMYYGTGPLGSAVLERLMRGNSPECILKAIRRLPGCPDDAETILDSFIRDLLDDEVLVSGPTNTGGDEDLDPALTEDGFDLTFRQFAEMSDWLLADPVESFDLRF